MNDSNIVAIPSHPPLPRGVPGVFHMAEQPYPSPHESKPIVRLQPRRSVESYHDEPPHMLAHGHPNRARSSSGYHPYLANNYRRDSAASFGPYDQPSLGSPNRGISLTKITRSRQPSVTSDKSSGSKDDRGGSSCERKYVCDWRSCGQSFDRIEHLNRHKRRHTGEKPYSCLVSRCNKLFSRFDNMMQHVGIHTFEGLKTEIPNIKNLNAKCNGRGRARRTSYRGSQDPYEKFRRHVKATLGDRLARHCILPADTPDFSNLTLRPLLVECDNSLSEAVEDQPLSQRMPADSQPAQRPRSDSVIDIVDKPAPVSVPAATPRKVSGPLTAPGPSKTQGCFSKFRAFPAPARNNVRVAPAPISQEFAHHRSSYPQLAPAGTSQPSQMAYRHSMSTYPPAAHMSNARSHPGYSG
ncbi:hypothetical protein LPJ63_001103 [Coemansia sp. RSA 2711]|nr:hypothetical protein LPJ63_001103 [Coemansia sp. RSA 2711]KAJ1839470.1 hypothetical protein LPJ70_005049 [Coemansia sp. RSA 2708]